MDNVLKVSYFVMVTKIVKTEAMRVDMKFAKIYIA